MNLQETLEALGEELDKVRIKVAELNKKLDDREVDLLNVRAEVLKEVGEHLDKLLRLNKARGTGLRSELIKYMKKLRGELPKEVEGEQNKD